MRVERVRLALLADLPAAGFAAFDVRLTSGSGAGPVVHAQGRTIENDRLRLEVTSDGTLNVLDKTSGRTFRPRRNSMANRNSTPWPRSSKATSSGRSRATAAWSRRAAS